MPLETGGLIAAARAVCPAGDPLAALAGPVVSSGRASAAAETRHARIRHGAVVRVIAVSPFRYPWAGPGRFRSRSDERILEHTRAFSKAASGR
jgi:hypothetical protein